MSKVLVSLSTAMSGMRYCTLKVQDAPFPLGFKTKSIYMALILVPTGDSLTVKFHVLAPLPFVSDVLW